MRNLKLYSTFRNMINRCEREKNNNFKHYGGKGVKICSEWRHNYKAFETWALESGWTPGLQIDRIDNDGDYSPKNCRITTLTENIRAASNTKLAAAQVSEIRKRLKSGERQEDIAKDYNVSRIAITHINTGRCWIGVK